MNNLLLINLALSLVTFDPDSLHLEPIEGGFSRSRIYSFQEGDQKYVLRYIETSRGESFRMDELAAHRAAASVGVAPEILYAEPHGQYVVMPFVEGHPLSREDLKSDDLIRSLARAIRKIHDFAGSYPCKATISERIAHQYKRGIETGSAFPSGFAEQVEKMLQEKPERMVPVHGDLNCGNVLVNGAEISLIDWAAGTLDDPFVDLSYICVVNDLNPHQEELFLSSYFGRTPTAEELCLLKTAKRKYYLIVAAIWFRFASTPQDQVGLLDQKLASPTLKNAEEYLREGVVVNIRTASKEEILEYALSFYKSYLSLSQEALNSFKVHAKE